jgi:glycosyltransferase involved in cell wall biosynthesis
MKHNSSSVVHPEDKWRVAKPEVSVVVPALNEELTIGEFIDWCWEGFSRAGVIGEVIIVDSSSDRTEEIALSRGAIVVRSPKKGLGQAYLDSLDYISGEFVIMGDCDLTYDFRELGGFVNSFRQGHEFVIGSRFRGTIEEGAMPGLHRYFGTPLTTGILNTIYGSKYTDIHCGMRGITTKALREMGLTSKGWEYASEMVLKASRMGLRTNEVPVNFFRDRDGRLSHHKRSGIWSPWIAGWINLKVMLVFSADTFLLWPSIVAFFLGAGATAASLADFAWGGSLGLGIGTLLGSMTTVAIAALFFQMAIVARLLHGLRSGVETRILRVFTYTKGMFGAFILGGVGISLLAWFVSKFLETGSASEHMLFAIVGLQSLLMSGIFFTSSLIFELFRRRAHP